MGLTSEQVHWIVGGVVSAGAITLILKETLVIRAAWPRYVLPIGLLGWGVEAIVDPFVHGSEMPGGYGAEALQHVLMGVVMLAAGGIELGRERGKLTATAWGFVLPVILLVLAAMFLGHAQHEAAVPPLVLIVQHRVLGLTLVVAGLAKALAVLKHERTKAFELGWLLVLLVVGLQFLAYTEGGSGHAGHGAPAPTTESAPSPHGGHK